MFDFSLESKDLKETTLKGKNVHYITNNDLKQAITNHLFQKYGIKTSHTNKYFIAIEPEKDIELLKKYKHLVYANTNQQIQLLILASFNGKPVCLLLDKQAMIYYVLKCQFSPSLYQGTIFEGEMVDTYFMISDFLAYLQKNIVGHAMDRRLNLLYSIMAPKNYHYDQLLDPFQVIVKDFVEHTELLSFAREYLPTLPYRGKVTGFIFRPNENSNKNLIYNFNHKHNFNLKKTEEETSTQAQTPKINVESFKEVKFLLFEAGNPDDYHLKLFGLNDQLIEYDYALVNDMKTSQMLQKLIDESSNVSKSLGICMLCRYYPTFGKWKPIQTVSGEPDRLGDLCAQ